MILLTTYHLDRTKDGTLPVGWGLSIGIGVLGLVGASYYIARHNKYRKEKAAAAKVRTCVRDSLCRYCVI